VLGEAEELGDDEIACWALISIIQIHCSLEEVETVEAFASQAVERATKNDNEVAVAKLRWGIANLFRSKDPPRCLDLLEQARVDHERLGLFLDAAALRLSAADIQLTLGDLQGARQDILLALPTISQFGLTHRARAALYLLERSLATDSIERSALEKLSAYLTLRIR
jgi:hypothetical protein